MLRGFDVSHHNGTVDWASLKSRYGITWGAAKATEGRSFTDSQFPANWRKMKAAGLVRMAYHFAHPDSSPADDAKAFLDYVGSAGGFGPEDIAVMDMEGNSNNLPMLQVRDWLAGWADIITRATGRKPFLYCGSGYITNNATKDLKPHYAAWWFPRYPSAYDGKTAWPGSITGYPTTNNWGVPDIWQFSQSFAGSIDANIANMTLADLKTRGTKTTAGVTPGQEDDMTLDELQDYMRALYNPDSGSAGQFQARTTARLTSLAAQVTALTAAVQTLADSQGVDSAGVIAAVHDAATAALADLKITLSTDGA